MQLTLKELLWLEAKLRPMTTPTGKALLRKTREELVRVAKHTKTSRNGKISAEERKAIDEYLKTTGVNVIAPVKPAIAKDTMFGLTGHEILAKLGLGGQAEEGQ